MTKQAGKVVKQKHIAASFNKGKESTWNAHPQSQQTQFFQHASFKAGGRTGLNLLKNVWIFPSQIPALNITRKIYFQLNVEDTE